MNQICHDFLIPSLEVLCVKLKLKEDAAAATFMAFGSAAAPILFSCITVAHGYEYIDLGIGSILGFFSFYYLIYLQLQYVWQFIDSWYLWYDFF